ncbi:MAG: Uma2 family endonuclease [Alteromonadaceae bacterium]|nr:Uma2 family endonuclease [Alteromonadaceae bacterium]
MTEAEYLNFESTAENKHQFIVGKVYAMAEASVSHNRIAGNIFSEFKVAFKGQPCESFISDMKVKALGDYYYPDVMVVCDDHKDDSDYVKHHRN